MIINERLKARRLELGLTMAEVASIVGVSEATVSRWESGHIENMKRDRIALYAKALQVSPAFIMGMENEHSIFDSIIIDSIQKNDEHKNSAIAKKIKLIRSYYKITQTQLGRIVGVSADTVSMWEQGDARVYPDKIGVLCQYFNIKPAEMLNKDMEINFENTLSPDLLWNVTEQEANLLYCFEKLNEEGRAAILSTTLAFTGMPQYKKCDTDDANSKGA